MLPSPSRKPAIYALVSSHIYNLPSVLPLQRSDPAVGLHRYKSILFPYYYGKTQCYLRSEPSSRTLLTGEQPDPWDLIQPQDRMSRHRGAKPGCRYELSSPISLLSPEYLLSVERWRFHVQPPDH